QTRNTRPPAANGWMGSLLMAGASHSGWTLATEVDDSVVSARLSRDPVPSNPSCAQSDEHALARSATRRTTASRAILREGTDGILGLSSPERVIPPCGGLRSLRHPWRGSRRRRA